MTSPIIIKRIIIPVIFVGLFSGVFLLGARWQRNRWPFLPPDGYVAITFPAQQIQLMAKGRCIRSEDVQKGIAPWVDCLTGKP